MCGGYGYRGTENNARIVMVLVLTIVVTLASTPVLAASGSDESINWYIMAMQLAGGLAIFLYGMEKMSDALKIVAGDRLRDILGKLTTNRFMGLITGAGVTAVVQSSSITTVMLVGFVSAGLMTSVQSIGVIFGANIGTTITAQIIAFKVTKFSLLLVAIGFVMDFAGKREMVKHYGSLIMGLGLIFFGLAIMSSGMKPLRSYEPFISLMQDVSNPAIGIAIALVFTAAVQSSSATTGVVIALATQGLITLEGGIALILGANIGTCVTAGLAAIGKDREAVRVAVAHVTFNIVGVFVIVWFIPYLAELVRAISPAAETLTGVDKLAAETPRQIANAHTIFNVGFSLLFLPFVGAMAKFCEIVVPTRVLTPEEVATAKFKPKFLDELLIRTPAMALSMARREIIRMSQVVDEMLSAIPETVLVGNVTKMKEVRDLDDQVDALYAGISRYLAKVGRENLSAADSDEAVVLITATSEVENIGDIVETHMSHLTSVCDANQVSFSEEDLNFLKGCHEQMLDSFRSAMVAVEHDRRAAAKIVLDMEEEFVGSMDKYLAERRSLFLRQDHTAQEMAAFTVLSDLIENLKRVYDHTKRIAKLVTREVYSTALVVAE